jgi:hypothetical protein
MPAFRIVVAASQDIAAPAKYSAAAPPSAFTVKSSELRP